MRVSLLVCVSQRRCVCACCVSVNVGMCVRVIGVCVRVRVSEEEVVGRRVGGGWVGGSARQSVGGSSPKK